jgi:hypothetical protein
MSKVSVTQHWTDHTGQSHSRRVFHGSDAAYDIWLDGHSYLCSYATTLHGTKPSGRCTGSDLTGRTQASEGGGGKTNQPLMMDGCHSTRAGCL